LGQAVEFTAGIAMFFITLTMLAFLIIIINRKFIFIINRFGGKIKQGYFLLAKPLLKYHRWFALGAVLAIAVHGYFGYNYRGVEISGIIFGGCIFLLLLTDWYKTYLNKKAKLLTLHMVLSVAAMLALLLHYAILD